MNPIVDLRSDTVTQPTEAMRAAMKDTLAQMLGFEAALFVPTGTQSNLCAILAHCGRGDEYIVGQMAHCYAWEGGGAAVFGSVQPQPLTNQPDGTLALDDIAQAIKPDDPHFAVTRLLALENTLGGKVLPFEYLQQASALAHTRGLRRHLDGARLFNAAVAQAAQNGSNPRSEARRIAQCFDSVSVCLSKGLGTPAGSVLCGSRELLQRALRIRKMAGGAMRQAGILAAAGSHALEHHVDRLAQDHVLARQLASGLQAIAGLKVDTPDTNIVFVELLDGLRTRADELIPFLKQRGVLASGLYRLRFVTHLDVDAAGVQRAIDAMAAFCVISNTH